MKSWPIEGDLKGKVLTALSQSPWFHTLNDNEVQKVCELGILTSYESGEAIVAAGAPSDSFFLLLQGCVGIDVARPSGEVVELGRVRPPFSFGEVGLLLGKPRTATVSAVEKVSVLSFDAATFEKLFDEISDFRTAIARGLASRLEDVSEMVLPVHTSADGLPDRETFGMLPLSFIKRHRVVPLRSDGNVLTVGFVEDPNLPVMAGVRQHLPGMEICPVRIPTQVLKDSLDARMDSDETQIGLPVSAQAVPENGAQLPERLASLLERVVAEGASDLHLLPGRKPVIRIDGEMHVLEDSEALGPNEAAELLEPLIEERHQRDFAEHRDVDFSLTAGKMGRFRANMYMSKRGVGAAVRQIPWKIISLDKLGMPSVLKKFCHQPRGLVLVTGPTGSGKSTTLAAMVDYINQIRKCHVLTLEDPIEFVHQDLESVISQREVGAHTESYERGLRAALREDPDVVLLGEIRDAEEAALALEIANTGHLVFATIHTNSAASSVERIIDLFPAQSQAQARSSLADSLRGIVSQTLCKARTGGRVAAVEVLVGTPAAANLIREGKPTQLPNVMQVGGQDGHQLLNEHLALLVKERKILRDEALTKTVSQKDLVMRMSPKPPADGDK